MKIITKLQMKIIIMTKLVINKFEEEFHARIPETNGIMFTKKITK